MLTRLKTGAWVVILIGAFAVAFWQHQQIKRLMAERAILRDQVGQAASQGNEIQRLAAQLKANVEGAEADRGELMRLRAQSSKLGQIQQENADLKIEHQRLASLVTQAKQTSTLSSQPQKQFPTSDVETPFSATGVTDLGVVELSDRTPMRLNLGEGKECMLTTTVLDNGQLRMVFTFESQIDGIPIQTEQTATVLPGRQIAQIINGVEIALKPTLKNK